MLKYSYSVRTISIPILYVKRLKYRGLMNFPKVLELLNRTTRSLCPRGFIPETMLLTGRKFVFLLAPHTHLHWEAIDSYLVGLAHHYFNVQKCQHLRQKRKIFQL